MPENALSSLAWIVGSGLLMSALALVGSFTLVLSERALDRLLLPLVAFAAGSLIGGAFLHMIPVGLAQYAAGDSFFLWILLGFFTFFVLEQFLHWHHSHRARDSGRQPMTYLILLGDGLHNFIGGLAIGGTFLIDIRLGIMAWLAAAAHEVPQELGDFAVLVQGGWSKRAALLFNVLSALTFLLGGLVAYFAAARIDVAFLVPFAAGNFIYIGASDLVPEVKRRQERGASGVHLVAFAAGLALMYLIREAFHG
jgi:zinc and cadmium transporter